MKSSILVNFKINFALKTYLLSGFMRIKAHSTLVKAGRFDVIFLISYIVRRQIALLK